MKRTQGIFKYAVAVAFLLVAITAPTATACNECDFLCSDIPPGFVELAVASCTVKISGGLYDFTIDGPTYEGCTAICNDCTNITPTTHPTTEIDWCINAYPEATILTFCEDEDTWILTPSPPIYQEPGRYYLKGGGGQDSAKCKYTDACTGTKSYRNKTPFTYIFRFTITRKKYAYYGPPGFDPYNDPLGECIYRNGSAEETKFVSQSTALISGQYKASICTADELAACAAVGALINCGSNN